MTEPTIRGGEWWIVGSLCVGALIGATIDTAQYLQGVYDVLGWQHIRQYGVLRGARMFLLAFPVWLALLCALGGPAWRMLHRRHFRGWAAAMILGALLTFTLDLYVATGFGLSRRGSGSHLNAWEEGGSTYIDNELTSHGWAVGLKNAGLFGLEGALVGLVVWRVAYRRQSKSRADD